MDKQGRLLKILNTHRVWAKPTGGKGAEHLDSCMISHIYYTVGEHRQLYHSIIIKQLDSRLENKAQSIMYLMMRDDEKNFRVSFSVNDYIPHIYIHIKCQISLHTNGVITDIHWNLSWMENNGSMCRDTFDWFECTETAFTKTKNGFISAQSMNLQAWYEIGNV